MNFDKWVQFGFCKNCGDDLYMRPKFDNSRITIKGNEGMEYSHAGEVVDCRPVEVRTNPFSSTLHKFKTVYGKAEPYENYRMRERWMELVK